MVVEVSGRSECLACLMANNVSCSVNYKHIFLLVTFFMIIPKRSDGNTGNCMRKDTHVLINKYN